MKTTEEEFPPPASFGFDRELAEAYTRLRLRALAVEIERDRDRYHAAITNCFDWANGRQSE
jgi:hypothetical protein